MTRNELNELQSLPREPDDCPAEEMNPAVMLLIYFVIFSVIAAVPLLLA